MDYLLLLIIISAQTFVQSSGLDMVHSKGKGAVQVKDRIFIQGYADTSMYNVSGSGCDIEFSKDCRVAKTGNCKNVIPHCTKRDKSVKEVMSEEPGNKIPGVIYDHGLEGIIVCSTEGDLWIEEKILVHEGDCYTVSTGCNEDVEIHMDKGSINLKARPSMVLRKTYPACTETMRLCGLRTNCGSVIINEDGVITPIDSDCYDITQETIVVLEWDYASASSTIPMDAVEITADYCTEPEIWQPPTEGGSNDITAKPAGPYCIEITYVTGLSVTDACNVYEECVPVEKGQTELCGLTPCSIYHLYNTGQYLSSSSTATQAQVPLTGVIETQCEGKNSLSLQFGKEMGRCPINVHLGFTYINNAEYYGGHMLVETTRNFLTKGARDIEICTYDTPFDREQCWDMKYKEYTRLINPNRTEETSDTEVSKKGHSFNYTRSSCKADSASKTHKIKPTVDWNNINSCDTEVISSVDYYVLIRSLDDDDSNDYYFLGNTIYSLCGTYQLCVGDHCTTITEATWPTVEASTKTEIMTTTTTTEKPVLCNLDRAAVMHTYKGGEVTFNKTSECSTHVISNSSSYVLIESQDGDSSNDFYFKDVFNYTLCGDYMLCVSGECIHVYPETTTEQPTTVIYTTGLKPVELCSKLSADSNRITKPVIIVNMNMCELEVKWDSIYRLVSVEVGSTKRIAMMRDYIVVKQCGVITVCVDLTCGTWDTSGTCNIKMLYGDGDNTEEMDDNMCVVSGGKHVANGFLSDTGFTFNYFEKLNITNLGYPVDERLITFSKSLESCQLVIPSSGSVSFNSQSVSKKCNYIDRLSLCSQLTVSYCKYNDRGLYESLAGGTACYVNEVGACFEQLNEDIYTGMEGILIDVTGIDYDLYNSISGKVAVPTSTRCVYKFQNNYEQGPAVSYRREGGVEYLISNHELQCNNALNMKASLLLTLILLSLRSPILGLLALSHASVAMEQKALDLSGEVLVYSEFNKGAVDCYKKHHDCIFYLDNCYGNYVYFKTIDGNTHRLANYYDSCFKEIVTHDVTLPPYTTEASSSGEINTLSITIMALVAILIGFRHSSYTSALLILLSITNTEACAEWDDLLGSILNFKCEGQPIAGNFETHLQKRDVIASSTCQYFNGMNPYEIIRDGSVAYLLINYYDNYLMCSKSGDLQFDCGEYSCIIYISDQKLTLPANSKSKVAKAITKSTRAREIQKNGRAHTKLCLHFPEYCFESFKCEGGETCYEGEGLTVNYLNGLVQQSNTFNYDEGMCSYRNGYIKYLDNYDFHESDDFGTGYMMVKYLSDDDYSGYEVYYTNMEKSGMLFSKVFACTSGLKFERINNKVIVELKNIEYSDVCWANVKVRTYSFLKERNNKDACDVVSFATIECKQEMNMCRTLKFVDRLGNFINPYGRRRIQAEANEAFVRYLDTGLSGLNVRRASYMYDVSYNYNEEYRKDVISFTSYCTLILFVFLVIPWVKQIYISFKLLIVCRGIKFDTCGTYPRMYPMVVDGVIRMERGEYYLAMRKFTGVDVDTGVIYRGSPDSFGHRLAVGILQTNTFFKTLCFPLYILALVPWIVAYIISINFENLQNAGGIRLSSCYEQAKGNLENKRPSKYDRFSDKKNMDDGFKDKLDTLLLNYFSRLVRTNGLRNVLDKTGDKSIDRDMNALLDANRKAASNVVGASGRTRTKVKRVVARGNKVPVWIFMWISTSILSRASVSLECDHPIQDTTPLDTWSLTQLNNMPAMANHVSQTNFIADYTTTCRVVDGNAECMIESSFIFQMPTYEGAVQSITLQGDQGTTTGYLRIESSTMTYDTIYEYHTYPFDVRKGEEFNYRWRISDGQYKGYVKCIGRNPLAEEFMTMATQLYPPGLNTFSFCTKCCRGPHPNEGVKEAGGVVWHKCVVPAKESPVTIHQILDGRREIVVRIVFPGLDFDRLFTLDGSVEQICSEGQCLSVLSNNFLRELKGSRAAFFMQAGDEDPIQHIILGVPGPGTTGDDGLRFGVYGFPATGQVEYADRFMNHFTFSVDQTGCHYQGDNIVNVTYDNWSRVYHEYEAVRGCKGYGVFNGFVLRQEKFQVCAKGCYKWMTDMWEPGCYGREENIIEFDMMMPSMQLIEKGCGRESLTVKLDLSGDYTIDIDEVKLDVDKLSCSVSGYMAEIAGIDIIFTSEFSIVGTLPDVVATSPIILTGSKVVFPDNPSSKGYAQGGLTIYTIAFVDGKSLQCSGHLENPDDITTGGGSEDTEANTGNSYSLFDDLWGIFVIAAVIGAVILFVILLCSLTGRRSSIKIEKEQTEENIPMSEGTDDTGYAFNNPNFEDVDLNYPKDKLV
uniref:Putative glycoprotein n=1 Tax=Wenling crustacean virus 8 TaxID=1923491 RepID=A0A1L3KPQ8_9VIRU|nr:putative glycoprotein [Wenling crustacean virus 8]